MKIVDRYMVKSFLTSFIWCLIMFVVMAVIIDIFSFIDDIVKYKIPAMSIAAFYVYYIPTILIQVTPMAALLSTIYILSNLNKHSEITAMKACGMSLWRILTPVLIMGFIISILTFIVNDRVIPVSSKVAAYIRTNELEKEKPSDFANKEWKSEYISYKDLKRYIKNFAGAGSRLVKGLYVDLHYKIAFPLISLIIIVIGAPFALITTRGGVLIGIGMSIGIGLLYYACIAISLAFGKAGLIPPPSSPRGWGMWCLRCWGYIS